MDDQRRVPGPKEQAIGEEPADAAVIERERRQPLPDDHKDQRDEASREHGHGRSATTPSEIPSRGWKDILLRVYRGIGDDRILANAGAVTFFALLALFPGIARAGLDLRPVLRRRQRSASSSIRWRLILPGGAIEVIGGELTRLTEPAAGKAGLRLRIRSCWCRCGAPMAASRRCSTRSTPSTRRTRSAASSGSTP